VAEQGAVLVELQNRRRLLAAEAGLLALGRFERVDRVGAMDDPGVVLASMPTPIDMP